MRDTRQKIMDAAMELVIEKGYSDTTTVDIAKRAGVNEATLFRRFGSKKEILQSALQEPKWVPRLDVAVFSDATGDLKTDLTRFMGEYFKRVTPDIVRLSIGLRSPQIFSVTAPYIMQVPVSWMGALEGYFHTMGKRGALHGEDPHALALTLFSTTLGYVFLQASFGKALTPIEEQAFIEASVHAFVEGIGR